MPVCSRVSTWVHTCTTAQTHLAPRLPFSLPLLPVSSIALLSNCGLCSQNAELRFPPQVSFVQLPRASHPLQDALALAVLHPLGTCHSPWTSAVSSPLWGADRGYWPPLKDGQMRSLRLEACRALGSSLGPGLAPRLCSCPVHPPRCTLPSCAPSSG